MVGAGAVGGHGFCLDRSLTRAGVAAVGADQAVAGAAAVLVAAAAVVAAALGVALAAEVPVAAARAAAGRTGIPACPCINRYAGGSYSCVTTDFC